MIEFEEQSDIECEFEPLVSAMIDDELSDEAKSNVTSHLTVCEHCQAMHAAFQTIDSVVCVPNEQTPKPIAHISNHDVTAESLRSSTTRFVPVAVAATLLVCISMIFVQDQPAKANPVSPEQVAQPMSDLHLINQQQRRDQELMLKVLGMDLRALKLEISHLPEGSQERVALTDQVNAMLEKVHTFQHESVVSGNLD